LAKYVYRHRVHRYMPHSIAAMSCIMNACVTGHDGNYGCL